MVARTLNAARVYLGTMNFGWAQASSKMRHTGGSRNARNASRRMAATASTRRASTRAAKANLMCEKR